jgi:hypothetical protein
MRGLARALELEFHAGEVVGGGLVHPRRQGGRDGVDVERVAGGDLLLDGRGDRACLAFGFGA